MEEQHRKQKRAIDETQKALRRQSILECAANLLMHNEYTKITVGMIAHSAGLANGTLFLYFTSKEELFLSLSENLTLEWSRSLQCALRGAAEGHPVSADDIAEILIASFGDPLLLKLFSIMDDTLEQNIDASRARDFKLLLKRELELLAEALSPLLRESSAGPALQILNHLFICLVGTYKVSTPSATVKTVIQEEGLRMFDIDFRETLMCITKRYLKGCVKEGR